ncbi:radical SAM protein [uncultured Desulfobulbus sp.]|uniref:radical SAM protein n=1 Tax=uncultured Desulfobulbus sp. TaxID=239745 RepID=UPI002602BE44|nr:radical SAM protein [uncultured Desulfobulbus sp.]
MPRAASLHASGQLERKAEIGRRLLRRCTLCPRRCRVDRHAGEIGVCGIGARARVASYGPHFGEEAVLVGPGGSGTIFLTGCSLRCCFCQNFDISQGDEPGQEVDDGDFAAIMLELQARGCSNINLVTPSHVVPQILAALLRAVEGGLRIPLVYNSSGYDSAPTLDLLAGAVDIYLPDLKFWLPATAGRYADAPDYPDIARQAIRSMHRQVGDLEAGADGLARRGLLVRHLLMPGQGEETAAILGFLATEISPSTYVNIMAQYHPCGQAERFPEICRGVSGAEYRQALACARSLGLARLDQPDLAGLLRWLGR